MLYRCRPATRTCVLILGGMLLGTVAAAAQARAPGVCPYDECALRLDGKGNVLRGALGRLVARSRFMRPPDLQQTFAGSDSASAHFRIVRQNYASGEWLSLLGLMAFGTAAVLQVVDWARPSVDLDLWELGFLVSSVPLIEIGAHRQRKARDALMHAIWWYNRDLATGR